MAAPRGEGPHGQLYGVFTQEALLNSVVEMVQAGRCAGERYMVMTVVVGLDLMVVLAVNLKVMIVVMTIIKN